MAPKTAPDPVAMAKNTTNQIHSTNIWDWGTMYLHMVFFSVFKDHEKAGHFVGFNQLI